MESSRFDRLTRLISEVTSRRSVLHGLTLSGLGAALGLSAVVLDPNLDEIAAKSNKKKRRKKQRRPDKGRGKGKDKGKAKAQEETCWRAGACNPKKGANVSRCNLEDYSPASTLDCTGCNASRANLRGANLQNANFTRANLSGACLVDANFKDATFANNTNLHNAIFCNTTMPGGWVNNADCGSGTACCAGCSESACDQTCCANACVNTQTSSDHCGTCGNACSGGQVCDSGTCVCSDNGPCAVTPSNLGGWVVASDGVTFVAGPETPPSGDGGVQLSNANGVTRATLKFPPLAGLPIADLETLLYSTYMQDGSTTGVVVPAIKLPVLYSSGTIFTTLIFEPTYSVGSDVLPNEWQSWDLLSADARWWSSKVLPGGICAFDCFVPWANILAAIPDAFINPDGLLIETGSGTPDAVGNADKLTVNGTTFDFEPD